MSASSPLMRVEAAAWPSNALTVEVVPKARRKLNSGRQILQQIRSLIFGAREQGYSSPLDASSQWHWI
jgi:hypothetical protein